MPPYLDSEVAWQALWPLPVAALVIALLTALLLAVSRLGVPVLSMLALATLGIAAGTLTGLSRDSAVGAVMPAVLSLVGGLTLYMLGLKHGDARLVSGCAIALSLSLLLGAVWGAVLRSDAEHEEVIWQAAQERDKTSLPRRKLEALDEVELHEFRVALGLPAIPESAEKAGSGVGEAIAAAIKKQKKGR